MSNSSQSTHPPGRVFGKNYSCTCPLLPHAFKGCACICRASKNCKSLVLQDKSNIEIFCPLLYQIPTWWFLSFADNLCKQLWPRSECHSWLEHRQFATLSVLLKEVLKKVSRRQESFIVCLYKGKGDALDRGNYRGLKLTEQAMKILERIVDGLIRQVVSIDDSQFGFVPGRGTTDAIFVVRQLQEKYLAVNKRLYMAFVDLEKAFDRVPRKVIWWALRKLGVENGLFV